MKNQRSIFINYMSRIECTKYTIYKPCRQIVFLYNINVLKNMQTIDYTLITTPLCDLEIFPPCGIRGKILFSRGAAANF